MLRSAIVAAFFISALNIFAQDHGLAHETIRNAHADRNYRAALAELENVRTSHPRVFTANNYDYLLARISEKSGDTAAAMASYHAAANRRSILREYALWHLSQLARSSGNLSLERNFLNELIAFAPESIPGRKARSRLARSWFDSGNYDSAIRSLDSLHSSSGPSSSRTAHRERLGLLAESYFRSGNGVKARETWELLLADIQNATQPDDLALAAVKGLDRLGSETAEAGNPLPQLSDWDHLRRAQVYHFNRDFSEARQHYAAIINDHAGSGIMPDAILQTGRTYSQQSNLTAALIWYERVQEQFPGHPAAAEGLMQAASAYAGVGKYAESVRRYQRYIEKYPTGDRLDRAYLNIIDVFRDSGEDTEALKWAEKIESIFDGKLPEALATFAEAKIYLSKNDWPLALNILEELATFSDLGGTAVAGGTTPAEVTFLRGFTLEQLRRYSEAIDAYISIPDGRNEYYGGRATGRLKVLAAHESAGPLMKAKFEALKAGLSADDPEQRRKNIQSALRLTDDPAERGELLDSLRTVYGTLSMYRVPAEPDLLKPARKAVLEKSPLQPPKPTHKTLADELLFLGLYDEGAAELEAAGVTGPPRGYNYSLAVLYTRGDQAYRGSGYIESFWKAPADFQIELIPSYINELLYPAPFADALIEFAPPRNVDPRFLLAVMRQESRFRTDVKSNAAARGLLQFISTTANTTAARVGRENFRQDDLYDPATSILLGSQYVSDLFRLFPNQPPAVAASYNGGEDNMKRWRGRSKSEHADRYVPEIMFAQTKDYVYRVMANYRMYQILYNQDLKYQ